MWIFILRRLLSVPAVLFGVSLIVFVLLRLAPGDFFREQEMNPAISLNDVLAQKEHAGLIN